MQNHPGSTVPDLVRVQSASKAVKPRLPSLPFSFAYCISRTNMGKSSEKPDLKKLKIRAREG
jgi:hypothetical protein